MNDVPRAPEGAAEDAVRVAGLSFQYPGGREALQDVSFALAAGERVALVGPSGAGKSTLLMHLNGLLPASLPERNGSASSSPVTVLGRPVTAANAAAVRQSVGFLFQDPDDQLFCPTVREDVAFGPLNLGLGPEEVRARVAEGLAAVGLAGFEDRSPLRLSVGERKRACLAGVLACRPEVLVLDEPSSNLDPRARRELLRNLDRFLGAQLIATHDLDFVVEHCPRVLVLDGGRVRADGPTDRLLRDAALMERHGLEVPLRLQLRKP